jgi:hypothetical protein
MPAGAPPGIRMRVKRTVLGKPGIGFDVDLLETGSP